MEIRLRPGRFPHSKEDIAMTYAKPQITKAAEAMEAICDDNSLLKIIGGVESTDPHRMTPPAYSADEE
jgi:hypothetical protein